MKKIAVFASGAGTNAARIIDHFNTRKDRVAAVTLIACNKPGAGVLSIAASKDIPVLLIDKERFFHGDAYIDVLKEKNIDLIVLAGFLWKIPSALISAFPERIVNIHPALLPKYGGKGMYGRYVHQAVIDNKEKESGITIHCVDDIYDHGKIIFQYSCPVPDNENAEELENRVRILELEHYPRVIEEYIK
ncbi:MAG TPA: phosphoribosylglycinamide formyltransferase [Chitinophagaceae bacterium]|nr:phosphoribosylglycinamide formyltransferase [Chitinophagaceae bacterium]